MKRSGNSSITDIAASLRVAVMKCSVCKNMHLRASLTQNGREASRCCSAEGNVWHSWCNPKRFAGLHASQHEPENVDAHGGDATRPGGGR
jgi:hypothetical protein